MDPDILLLDEVLAVGDEAFQSKCLERIYEHRRGGGTLVFVSHDPGAVERVCDRALLMVSGTVEEDGDPSRVLAAYHRLLADESSNRPETITDAQQHASSIDESASGPPEWGDGPLRIWRAEMSTDGSVRSRFLSGDPLRITLAVQAQTPIERPGVALQIQDLDGRVCFATDTDIGDVARPRLSEGEVLEMNFDIPALHLHEGVFTLSIDAVDGGVSNHHIENALTFSVYAANPGRGIVDLSGAWSTAYIGRPASSAR